MNSEMKAGLAEICSGSSIIMYNKQYDILKDITINDVTLEDELNAYIDDEDSNKDDISSVFDNYGITYLQDTGFMVDELVYEDEQLQHKTELLVAVSRLDDIADYREDLISLVENTMDDVMYVILRTLNGYLNMDTYFTIIDAITPTLMGQVMKNIYATDTKEDEGEVNITLNPSQLKAISEVYKTYGISTIPLEIASREYTSDAKAALQMYDQQFEVSVNNAIPIEDTFDEDEVNAAVVKISLEYITVILPYVFKQHSDTVTINTIARVMDVLDSKTDLYISDEMTNKLNEAVLAIHEVYKLNGVYLTQSPE